MGRINYTIFFLICLLLVSVFGSCANNEGNRLIVIQGIALNAYYKGKYRTIWRAELFYGYGWIDGDRVFVAYQPREFSDARAIIKIVDLKTEKTIDIHEIGAAGESNFDSNPITHEIVFTDTIPDVNLRALSCIRLITIHDDNTYAIKTIKTGGSPWAVFWIDKDTIGYLESDEKEDKQRTLSRSDFAR